MSIAEVGAAGCVAEMSPARADCEHVHGLVRRHGASAVKGGNKTWCLKGRNRLRCEPESPIRREEFQGLYG